MTFYFLLLIFLFMPEQQEKPTQSTPPSVKLLRGFKDVLPENERYWDALHNAVVSAARDYGFEQLITPVLEDTALYERAYEESFESFAKTLYRFNLPRNSEIGEEGGRSVALRPETTASTSRAYLEHGMINQPQPVKLWQWGPVFRLERPQASRYRQHHQFGFDVLGEDAPIVDAQLIIMMHSICISLGLDIVVPINSLGDRDDRAAYTTAVVSFVEDKLKEFCSDCRKRFKLNPLLVFSCGEDQCRTVLEDAPQTLDFLSEDARNHFIAVLEFLDELDIPYALNPHLIRDAHYYSRTIFEVYLKDEYEAHNTKALALCGGGRYDDLSKQFTDKRIPAVGLRGGIERIMRALQNSDAPVPSVSTCDVFVAQLGSEAKRSALRLFEQLRGEGWRVAESFSNDGLSQQLEYAQKREAKLTLIMGQKEMLDGTVIMRDMSSGIQEEINANKLMAELKKRIPKIELTNGLTVIDESEQPAPAKTVTGHSQNGKEVDNH